MPFKKSERRIGFIPKVRVFKPAGIPMGVLRPIYLNIDELEAMRLVDMEHLKQDEAAKLMEISSSTLQRLIEKAREKITWALIHGLPLIIEGGEYKIDEKLNEELQRLRSFRGGCRRGRGWGRW